MFLSLSGTCTTKKDLFIVNISFLLVLIGLRIILILTQLPDSLDYNVIRVIHEMQHNLQLRFSQLRMGLQLIFYYLHMDVN